VKAFDIIWTDGPVRDKRLPKIPAMPLNERNAAEILKHLGGAKAPDDREGGLPITYRIGPGPVMLEMDVQNDERVTKMRSVIGVIRGSEEPEKLVILGNHLDAWVYGAVAILETARALGQAVKKGHRPRRTIVFAVWDGEEPLLGGSTQWALDNAEDLRKNAVVIPHACHVILQFRCGDPAVTVSRPSVRSMFVKDRDKSIEETENLDQKHSREQARKVERSRDGPDDGRKDLDPSPDQRTVQPSDRTRKSG
jgi:hypothetical protein